MLLFLAIMAALPISIVYIFVWWVITVFILTTYEATKMEIITTVASAIMAFFALVTFWSALFELNSWFVPLNWFVISYVVLVAGMFRR